MIVALLFLSVLLPIVPTAPLRAQLPGAGAIVYVRSGDLYVTDLEGPRAGEQRLLEKNVGMANLDPTTLKVAFYRDGKLWIKPIGGEARPVRESVVASPIGPPSWNGKNGWLLFDSAKRMEVQVEGEPPQAIHLNSVSVVETRPFVPSTGCMVPEGTPIDAISWEDFQGSPETMPSTVGGASWSPDGKRIALCRGGDLWIIDDLYLLDHTTARWPGANRLAAIGSLDAHRGSAENEGSEGGRTLWSPDGKTICVEMRLASHFFDTYSKLCDAVSGRVLATFGGGSPCFWGGKLILSDVDGASHYAQPYVVNLRNNQEQPFALRCDQVIQVLGVPYR